MEPSSIVYGLTAGAVFTIVGLVRGHRERHAAAVRERWQRRRAAVRILRGVVSREFVTACRRADREHHGLEHVRRELQKRFRVARSFVPPVAVVLKRP